MIPHRLPSRENSGNAVRYRIAACRKRLREIRANHRPQIHMEIGEECRYDEAVTETLSPFVADENGIPESNTRTGTEAGIT